MFLKVDGVGKCDESGMPLEQKIPKIIAEKGAKKVRQIN